MESLRFKALDNLSKGLPKVKVEGSAKITAIFNENVFTLQVARKYLSDEAYKSLVASIRGGKKIDRNMGSQIANGIRAWSESKGVTHFTHWFQPLTGLSAEKHDSFFTLKSDGTAIEEFDGGALIQQEPDASSFPSGGLRATFEARGYTAWDPSSPPFIMEIGQGKTLCIPTIFVSYTGESLDTKTPLLKAVVALDKAATDVCHYFDKNVTRVTATLGWEQEYFLIDEALFYARPDIMAAGRALFGHTPAKGQQLEDHYFGSIPERAQAFMRDFETESLKLGIPVKTRHNEVAPNQFECAPVFEELNLAVDHNMLLMDVMEKTARKHDFRVLFHEKPYAGVNGSGKHNNWSLATNTGKNLLRPAKTPKENMLFLAFFVNTIKAIHSHADVLRACIASAGNDHRLGANEAPPAIISVFIGEYLTNLLDGLEKNIKGAMSPASKTELKLDIGRIPSVMLDNTDRNRTSPFAFTGNKFEFRALGSSMSLAFTNTVLNTIVAEAIDDLAGKMETAEGDDLAAKVIKVVTDSYVENRRIIFGGDGYSEEWQQEAEKRGLKNLRTTPDALPEVIAPSTVEVFGAYNVLSERELEARFEVWVEQYAMNANIEAETAATIARTQIIPAVARHLILLDDADADLLEKESRGLFDQLVDKTLALEDANGYPDGLEEEGMDLAIYARDRQLAAMHEVRVVADRLERIVSDNYWPLPKYSEMMFIK